MGHDGRDDGNAGYSGLAATLLLGALAGCFFVTSGESGSILINLLLAGSLVVFLAGARTRSASVCGPPFPEQKILYYGIPALLAAMITIPSLGIPYLGDDYAQLKMLGETKYPWEVFYKHYITSSWRPVAGVFWWFYAHLAPGSAGPARLASILLFASSCAMLPILFRRFRASRGVAFTAALLFACSPITTDIVCWTVNQYTLIAGFCGIAAVVFCNPARPRFRDAALLVILLTIGFLAKEDAAVFLPVWLAAGGTLRKNTKIRMIAFAAAVVALGALSAIRIFIFSEGSYIALFNQSTRDGIAATISGGFVRMFATENLFTYFAPFRYPDAWLLPRLFQGLQIFIFFPAVIEKNRSRLGMLTNIIVAIPPLSLATAVGTWIVAPGRRREFRRAITALCLAFLMILPVAAFAPIQTLQFGSRLLFNAQIGFCWLIATFFIYQKGQEPFRWARTVAWISFFSFVSIVNSTAWWKSGYELNRSIHAVARAVASAPTNRAMIVYGLPDAFAGVPCARNATQGAMETATGRTDLKFLTISNGFDGMLANGRTVVDDLYIIPKSGGDAVRWRDRPSAGSLTKGGSGGTFIYYWTSDWIISESGSLEPSLNSMHWNIPAELMSVLHSPKLTVPRGSELAVSLPPDANSKNGGFMILASFEDAGKIIQIALPPDGKLKLPRDAGDVCFHIASGGPGRLTLTNLTVMLR